MTDTDELGSRVVRIGGRRIEGGWDRVARYCGLPWSGGDNETWGFRYYDSVFSPPDNTVRPHDVLATSALHPGLSKTDLAFFHDERRLLSSWLADLPVERGLGGCEGAVIAHIAGLATWDVPVSLQLLTKVLHRKRPHLIPLVDRHVVDWFRPVTGERSPQSAWPGILRAIRDDSDFVNTVFLHKMASEVELKTFETISALRVMDIIVWMGNEA